MIESHVRAGSERPGRMIGIWILAVSAVYDVVQRLDDEPGTRPR